MILLKFCDGKFVKVNLLKLQIKKIIASVAYVFFWSLGYFFYKLPFLIKKNMAFVLAFLLYRIFAFRRAVVLLNLSQVFPRAANESMQGFRDRCFRLGFENYIHYFLCLFEIFERFHWKASDTQSRVRVHGAKNLESVASTGFFFLTAHIGNWELISRVIVSLDFKLAIITKFLRNSFFDLIWIRSRKRYGLELLEEEGSGLKIIKAIRQHKCVGFILDQHTGAPHGVPARFLGLPAETPKGLAILSARLKASIVPTYLLRAKDGTFDLYFDAPLKFIFLDDPKYWQEKQLTQEGILRHIELCNQNMESYIRRFPEQYLWLHKRFKGHLNYSKITLPWDL